MKIIVIFTSIIFCINSFAQQTQEESIAFFNNAISEFSNEHNQSAFVLLNKSLKGGWIELKQIKKNIVFKSLDIVSKKQLLRIAKAQLDRKKNKKNRDIEAFFKFILKRDQRTRIKNMECVCEKPFSKGDLSSPNWKNVDIIDSCTVLYNYEIDDSINKISIDSIIDMYGWPPRMWIGKGRAGLFVYLKHLNDDYEELETLYLPEMKKALTNFSREDVQIDYYEDFLLLYRYCKPQKHNTITNYNWETRTRYIVKPKCNK